MHSLTLRHLLPGVHIPTLVVWGREDAIAPLDCGEIYARSIAGARLVTIPDCGHLPEIEQPAEFPNLVRDFLAT
jgi:pimeloyl-ACP methyl ester carboxylesterase